MRLVVAPSCLVLASLTLGGCPAEPSCLQGPVSSDALVDTDGDGFCAGYDCDDSNAEVHPRVETEVCDGIDNDCDPSTFPTGTDSDVDADGDGVFTCDTTDDCDDDDPTIAPGLEETCDGRDENCDGQIDEGLGDTHYPDLDGDGFGNTSQPTQICAPEAPWTERFGDCDDTNPLVHPDADEVCNDLDDDCDGITDPGPQWERLSDWADLASLPHLSSMDSQFERVTAIYLPSSSLAGPLTVGSTGDFDSDNQVELVLHSRIDPHRASISFLVDSHPSEEDWGRFIFEGHATLVPNDVSPGTHDLLWSSGPGTWSLSTENTNESLAETSTEGTLGWSLLPNPPGEAVVGLSGPPTWFVSSSADEAPRWVTITGTEPFFVPSSISDVSGPTVATQVSPLVGPAWATGPTTQLDLDQDGSLDWIEGYFDQLIVLWGDQLPMLEASGERLMLDELTANPTLGFVADLSAFGSVLSPTVGDYDGDGFLDVAQLVLTTGELLILWGDTLASSYRGLGRTFDPLTDGLGQGYSLIPLDLNGELTPNQLWTLPAPTTCGDQPDGLILRASPGASEPDVALVLERMDLGRGQIRPLSEQSPIAFTYATNQPDSSPGPSLLDSPGDVQGDTLPDFVMIPDRERGDVFIIHDLRAPDPLD